MKNIIVLVLLIATTSISVSQIRYDLTGTTNDSEIKSITIVTNKDSTIYDMGSGNEFDKIRIYQKDLLKELTEFTNINKTIHSKTHIYNHKLKTEETYNKINDKVYSYLLTKGGITHKVEYQKNQFEYDSIKTTLINDTIVAIQEYTYNLDDNFYVYQKKYNVIPSQSFYRGYIIDPVVRDIETSVDSSNISRTTKHLNLSAKGDTLIYGFSRKGKNYTIDVVRNSEGETQTMHLGKLSEVTQVIAPTFNKYSVMNYKENQEGFVVLNSGSVGIEKLDRYKLIVISRMGSGTTEEIKESMFIMEYDNYGNWISRTAENIKFEKYNAKRIIEYK